MSLSKRVRSSPIRATAAVHPARALLGGTSNGETFSIEDIH